MPLAEMSGDCADSEHVHVCKCCMYTLIHRWTHGGEVRHTYRYSAIIPVIIFIAASVFLIQKKDASEMYNSSQQVHGEIRTEER